MNGWMRALTPLGWLVVVIVMVLALTLIGRGLGLRWDPLGLSERRLRAEVARNETLETDLAARRLEREDMARSQAAQAARTAQRVELARATVAAETLSRIADDADVPLEAGRLERLRAHDRRLCELSPGLCADNAPAGDIAAGGDATLSVAPGG